mgnify:CR=1 FL=1
MKKILFVCSGNYYRSRFAEAYFNYLSDMFSLDIKSESRGLAIHFADELAEEFGEISKDTRERCNALGIPETYWQKDRESLKREDFDSFNQIICLDLEEHAPMVKEQFPDQIYSVCYLKVKDVFDWEPKQTLDTISEIIQEMISNSRKSKSYAHIFSDA